MEHSFLYAYTVIPSFNSFDVCMDTPASFIRGRSGLYDQRIFTVTPRFCACDKAFQDSVIFLLEKYGFAITRVIELFYSSIYFQTKRMAHCNESEICNVFPLLALFVLSFISSFVSRSNLKRIAVLNLCSLPLNRTLIITATYPNPYLSLSTQSPYN